jgi:hypothetical protein
MRKVVLVSFFLLFLSLSILQDTQTEANPMKIDALTEPINDPPTISIQSPTNTTYYQNTLPLNITITQPQSWIGPETTNESELVIGPNSIKLITCKLDGQLFNLWNGTLISEANTTKLPISQFSIDYYLPIISEFSAILTAEKGAHTLEIDVQFEVTYYPYIDFPFAYRNNIDTSSNVTFTVGTYLGASKLQGIDSIHTPILFLNRSYPNITVTIPTSKPPEVPPYPLPKLYPFPTSNQNLASNYWLNPTSLTAIASVIIIIAIVSLSLVYLKRSKNKLTNKQSFL